MLPPEKPSNQQGPKSHDKSRPASPLDTPATPPEPAPPLAWSAGDGGAVETAPSGPTCSINLRSLPSLLREDIEDAPFWKEVAAFASMPEREIEPYFGKYVAVYKGDIVDSDADEGELALRFYRTFGYVPVYIHAVGVEDSLIDLND